MVIDTSAIFAIIAQETDSVRYRDAIKTPPLRLISAVTLLEITIVLLSKHGAAAIDVFEELLREGGVIVVPFDRPLADAAFVAFRRYGEGRGHPAQLNICDCAAYALAQAQGLPLLFKGEDFARTDVISALD